jgi:putative flavoprotein involved in K+ transport
VGAGQAGLGVSYFLQRDGRKHLVFERGRIGESWLSQRWDSSRLNTPRFMSILPGLPYDGQEPDGFGGSDELVGYFQRYVERFQLPVRAGVRVVSVERDGDDGYFIVKTRSGQQSEETVLSRSVVIASGIQLTPKTPAMGSGLPLDITQVHTAECRSPAALPPGASSLSTAVSPVARSPKACWLPAGRISIRQVGRAPRRYRGRELLEWWIDMGFLDVTYASLEKSISRAARPQISGTPGDTDTP